VELELILGRRLSCSWIFPEESEQFLTPLKEAVDEAESKEVLMVCAAGNTNNHPNLDNDKHKMFPASYQNSNIISVANIDEKEELNSGSHFGANSVHIAAPGTLIWSTFRT
jgi:hypothetical protein